MLRPFFSYYGSKWRAALRYPLPRYSTIIEPFAGSAGYSLRFPRSEVVLVDTDPIVAGLWQWLIRVSEAEIRSLPLKIFNVDELDVCQEAKWLIGFWINQGSVAPRRSPSKWMVYNQVRGQGSQWWGPEIRERVASQLGAIRHWKIYEADYRQVRNREATWFVDPPYHNRAGALYVHSDIKHRDLGQWCLDRLGQVIVCEQTGADWLPFEPHARVKTGGGRNGKHWSDEVLWAR